jgi:hypothetical protein
MTGRGRAGVIEDDGISDGLVVDVIDGGVLWATAPIGPHGHTPHGGAVAIAAGQPGQR